MNIQRIDIDFCSVCFSWDTHYRSFVRNPTDDDYSIIYELGFLTLNDGDTCVCYPNTHTGLVYYCMNFAIEV